MDIHTFLLLPSIALRLASRWATKKASASSRGTVYSHSISTRMELPSYPNQDLCQDSTKTATSAPGSTRPKTTKYIWVVSFGERLSPCFRWCGSVSLLWPYDSANTWWSTQTPLRWTHTPSKWQMVQVRCFSVPVPWWHQVSLWVDMTPHWVYSELTIEVFDRINTIYSHTNGMTRHDVIGWTKNKDTINYNYCR